MVTVSTSPTCGNAPRQTYVRELLVAAARGERDLVVASVAPDWTHRVAGRPPATGEDGTDELMTEMAPPGLESLDFTVVLSHGKFAAASGWLSGRGMRTEFSCVFTFTGHSNTARIAECVTYLVTH